MTNLVLALAEVDCGHVVCIDKDLLESEAEQIVGGFFDVLPVLGHKLAGRLGEDKIDLLERLILCLGHEEELVEPAHESDSLENLLSMALRSCIGKNTTTLLDECTQLCKTPFRTVFGYTVRALRTD